MQTNTTTPAEGYMKISASVGDSRFPSFLQGFNRRWTAAGCQAVYLCYTPQGTALALDDAIGLYGHCIKIKCGGHCYENFVFNGDTLAVIDVTPMASYGYDEEKGYYLESGGTNWSAFQALFRDYGKVLPAGSCYSVGLGGHICGGGYGLLSRLNGLTIDWLTGIEVVVKDKAEEPAYPVYVFAGSSHPDEEDLYWAHCGGGGGNFGVITKYYFKQLPPAPKSAFISSVTIPWSDLTSDRDALKDLLALLADIAIRDDNWRQFAILALNHQAAAEVHFALQTVVLEGEDAEAIKQQHTAVLKTLSDKHPYRRMSKPGISQLSQLFLHAADTVEYTFYEAVQTLNGSGTNQRGKYKSAYMRKPFPNAQVETILKWLQKIPECLEAVDMTQSLLQIDSYGGRINERGATSTAIPQRSSILKLQYQTYWGEMCKDTGHLDWIRGFYEEMYEDMGGIPDPHKDSTHTVDGCYYNYPDVDLNGADGDKERALELYFGVNLPRLKRVKHRWDPENYFRHAQSIG